MYRRLHHHVNQGSGMGNTLPFPPGTFSQNTSVPSLAAKYKMLATGGNDPHISSRMKYAHYAKNSPVFHRYPILNLKQPPTGIDQPVVQASVKQSYLPNNSGVQLMTKTFCIQYSWQ